MSLPRQPCPGAATAAGRPLCLATWLLILWGCGGTLDPTCADGALYLLAFCPPQALPCHVCPNTCVDGACPADGDDDGLDIWNELRLGTDPESADTDGDGLPDADEVGDNLAVARDSDGDGYPDVLESDLADNDDDGVVDAHDPSTAWQVENVQWTPFAIWTDGLSRSTLTVRLNSAVAVTSVQLAASPFDQLAADGAAVTDTLEVFDDGSHGDARAGDGLFTRVGVTSTRVASGSSRGLGEVGFDTLTVSVGGSSTSRSLDQALHNPSALMLVDPRAEVPVTEPAPGLRATSRVAALFDRNAAYAVRRWFGKAPGADLGPATAAVLRQLPDSFDFLILFTPETAVGAAAGTSQGVRNDTSGIGGPFYDNGTHYGSQRLQQASVINLSSAGPILHELMHRWAVRLDPSFGFGSGPGDGHWGYAGVHGALGGFDPATFVDLGGGRYGVGPFAPNNNNVAYAPIELYLMGLADAAEVAPILVVDNPTYDGNDIFGTGTHQVAIADIVAKHGPRLPAVGDAPSQFTAAFATVADRVLTDAELTALHIRAATVCDDAGSTSYLSFAEATGGRGELWCDLGL